MYLVVENSLPANKKSPHIPNTPTSPTIPSSPTTPATRSPRFRSRDQAEGWTGDYNTEYME